MADIDRDLIFTRLPPDSGVVTPIAPLAEDPDETTAAQLDKMRLALPNGSRERSRIPFSACATSSTSRQSPTCSRCRSSSASYRMVVYERIQEDIPKEDLIKILDWIATHPFDGDDKAVDELRPLGLFNGPADMEQTRDGRACTRSSCLEESRGDYAGKRKGVGRESSTEIGEGRGVGEGVGGWGVGVEEEGTYEKTDVANASPRHDGHADYAGWFRSLGHWGGGWSFAWGVQDDDESIAAMRHAVERGVNWIDTAAVYGLGHSEELVGRLLRDYPASDRPYVFTKCGLVWDEQRPMTQSLRIGEPRRCGAKSSNRSPGSAWRKSISIRCTGRRKTARPLEVYWQTLLELKKEGKIRAVGLRTTRWIGWNQPSGSGTSTRSTAVLPYSPRRARRGVPWCPRTTRAYRLQPDAIGTADGSVQRSTGGGARHRRLAVEVAGIPGPASRTTWRSPTRCGRSPRAMPRPSAPSPSRGPSRPRPSPAPSSALATRNRWMGRIAAGRA